MQCSSCGTELIPGKRFCHACGTRVVVTCPQCKAAVEPGFRFCPDCGFQLASRGNGATAPEAAAAPAADGPAADRLARLTNHIPESLAEKIRATAGTLSGERKLVTVLFCDLVGSTAIAERLDPEEYRDLLERYLELAFAEIYRFEGIVNQLAGDGLMALFGAPIAHEDAPERALRAALAIVQRVKGLRPQGASQLATADAGLSLRIGIHTGPVVVGAVGNDFKMDYTATGDTTNLAARLQALAAPGAVLVSEATYRLVRGLFVFRDAGPLTVKGKSEPVMAYEVLRATAPTAPIEIAAERGLTPLVGRDQELAQLGACFERLSGNLAQVVAVVGQAGSGKSRLVYEFKQRLADTNATIFEARCSSLSQMTPYAPWVNMLRQYFDITPGDVASCACEKIALRVQTMDPQLDYINPFLCHILAMPTDGISDLPADELKRGTFEAVAKLVVSASRRAPVVMIIEDLHWIDESSREMLELAVTELCAEPVMLVITHRPDYEPSWHTRAAFTQLNLHALSDDQTTAIIRSLAGGRPPLELEQRILVKAEGNPFVAEEITRALVEDGDLVAGNGELHLRRPAAMIPMPDTLQELIAARLDRLGPQAKRVVQVAAVLGRQFHRAQLAQLLDGEEISLDVTLEELQRRGVIHRKDVLSREEFRFGESVTQEVAYEGLLLKQRRQLHERIGALIEGTGGEAGPERSMLLAHHYARSDNREKALEALLRAARDAEAVPSFAAAVGLYRQAWEMADAALTSLPGADDRLRRCALEAAVGLCRGVVLYDTPDRGSFEHAAVRGRELAEAFRDTASVAALYTFQGMRMSNDRERFGDGVAFVEKGLALARQSGLDTTPLSISRALGWNYLLDGRFELAQRTYDWVVSELQEKEGAARPSDLHISSRWMRDVVRYWSDDLDAAMAGLTETHELAVHAPNRTIQSASAGSRALIHFSRAQYADAQRWAERGIAVGQAIGNMGSLRTATVVALATRVALGDLTIAPAEVDLIEQGLKAGGNLLLNIGMITDAFLALDDLEHAERFARLAQERAAGRLRQLLSAIAMGDVLARRGSARWDEAHRWYDEATQLAETLAAQSALAAARLGSAELAAARGDHDTSAAAVAQARAISQHLGLPRYMARAERIHRQSDAGIAQHA